MSRHLQGYMRLLTTAYGHCKPTYHSDKLKHTTLCAPSTGGQDNERHSAPLISYPADYMMWEKLWGSVKEGGSARSDER